MAPLKEAKQKIVEEFEKEYISNLLLIYNGNITRSAVAAGKHRRAFLYLIQKHGIDVQRYRNSDVSNII
jgi:DNA-binding NtrC family response regulator